MIIVDYWFLRPYELRRLHQGSCFLTKRERYESGGGWVGVGLGFACLCMNGRLYFTNSHVPRTPSGLRNVEEKSIQFGHAGEDEVNPSLI